MTEPSGLQLIGAVRLREEHASGALLLDTRPAEQFAALHVHGSLQISLPGRFAAWAAILIERAARLVLIAEDAGRAEEARERLERVGLGRVIGYSVVDASHWRNAGMALARLPVRRCKDIHATLPHPVLQLIDARSRAEWLRGHLPGAISMPLLELESKAHAIDPSRHSLIYCHEGFRATTAASILLRRGVRDVGVLLDGVEGWQQLGLPLRTPEAAPA